MDYDEVVVSNKLKLLWIRIPKNCTTIMQVWVAINHGYDRDLIEIIDFIEDKLAIISNKNQFKRYMNKYCSLIILRNPYTRFISAFCDKFIYRRGDMETSLLLEDLDLDKYPMDVTFSEIINIFNTLSKEELYNINSHWRPQYTFFDNIDNLEFDYIFSKETFRKDLQKLCNENNYKILDKNLKINDIPYSDIDNTQVNINNIKVIKFITEVGKIPKVKYFLTKDIRAKIYEIYKKDFNLYFKHFNKTEEDLYKEAISE